MRERERERERVQMHENKRSICSNENCKRSICSNGATWTRYTYINNMPATEQIYAHWRDTTDRTDTCALTRKDRERGTMSIYLYLYIYIYVTVIIWRVLVVRGLGTICDPLSLSLSAPASCIVHKKVISHLNSEGEKLIANSKSPQFCKLNNRQRERERERERKEKTCMKTRGINLYTLSRNYIHDWWIIGLMMMQTASSSQSHINIHL